MVKSRFSLLPMTASRWLWTGTLLAALVAVTLAIATRAATPANGVTPGGHAVVGAPAPHFALPAEQNGQLLAQPISLAAERGHPVVLFFFYSLCPHCLDQAAAVQTLAAQETVHGLGVFYINSPAESSGIIAAYAQRLGITAPVLLDKSGRVAANYGIASYPATVLVDGNGTVREVWIGETGVDSLRSAITPLLAGALRAPAAQTAWMGRHV